MMKSILKKAVVPIFLSILCGSLCGRVVYGIYLSDDKLSFNNNLIYLVQSGAYSSYDNMRANTIGYDYVYYEEDDLYKTVIGVTKNRDNVEKIKKIYGREVIVSEYYSNDSNLNNLLSQYDYNLLNETDDTKIKEIVIEMLNIYKDEDVGKLIKVS